jgi:hypothetical protein
MVEKLYTGKISSDDFKQLIASWHFPDDTDDTWVLAEQIPNRVIDNPKSREERQKMLLYKYFQPNIQFADYNTGRIFRENMEIRWEKQGSDIHTVYLGTEEYIPLLRDYKLQENLDVLKTTQAETKSYYLFGERLKAEDLRYMDRAATTEHFAEVRIPQLLLYPVQPNTEPYVCLKVREYIDTKTGIVALFRFQKLESSGGKA